jgi:hypothetical protein
MGDWIVLKTIIPFLIAFSSIWSQTLENAYVKTFPLTSAEGLELINVTVDEVEYIGKEGIQVSGIEGKINVEYLAIVPDIIFKDGIIEIELTGEPAPNADPQMRGFVGIAFRIDTSNYSSYECFYLRPTNARADDQLRRNHSVQYVSHPEYPWYKLRNDSPGLYESYVDLVPGEWTKIKIEVTRRVAKLYVHGSEQPCLIVNDLKHDVSEGKIALWLHTSTLARYRNLVVTSN